MNLHIANDEKFIDGFILNEARYTDTENQYLIVKIHGEVRHVKSDNVTFVNNDLDSLTSKINEISDIDKIYFHSLTSLFADIIKQYKGKYKLIWLLFGGEVFMLNSVRQKVIMRFTKNLLAEIHDDWFKLKLNPIMLRREIINYKYYGGIKNAKDEKIKSAIINLDYIGHYIHLDITQFIKKINPNIKWIDWNYYARDQVRPSSVFYEKHNKILLGHSGSEFNNHLDAIRFLTKINGDFDILVPLSYGGNKKYVESVCEKGTKYLKSRFIPQLDFVELNEYYKNIATCKAAIFFNLRSQAAANILSLLELEIPVFMQTSNNLYTFLTQHEIHVYKIEQFENFIKNGLTEKDKILMSENKVKLEAVFGNPIMKIKYSNLLTI